MKVKNIKRIIAEESELEITGATLLTVEEAKKLPKRLREYRDWWWLKTQGNVSDSVAVVTLLGYINKNGVNVAFGKGAVRPVLIISNTESSGLKIGDTFEFGDKQFEIISDDKAFCLTDIGLCNFREDWRADDANNYEKSDVKKYIDEWFKKSIEEVNSKENEIKETNKNESIYKCRDCRSEIRCPCNPDGDACGFFYPKNILLIKIEESLLEKFLPEENKFLSPQERDVLLHLIEKDLNKRKY